MEYNIYNKCILDVGVNETLQAPSHAKDSSRKKSEVWIPFRSSWWLDPGQGPKFISPAWIPIFLNV